MPDDESYRTASTAWRNSIATWQTWRNSPQLDRPPHSLRRSAERAALDLAIAELRRIARIDPYGITSQTLAKIAGLVALDEPRRP